MPNKNLQSKVTGTLSMSGQLKWKEINTDDEILEFSIIIDIEKGIKIDNTAQKIQYNETYEATLIVEENYVIDTIIVKMGEQEIPVDKTNGKIKIENVTDDIKIIATVKLVPLEIETGKYVQYTANHYSKWIVVGTDENGVTRIVSVGGTESYTMNANSTNERLIKLNEYCNQTYVDSNLAISAESYNYGVNIAPFTSNPAVLWGNHDETTEEAKLSYPYAWFINGNEYRGGPAVYELGTGNFSYIDYYGSDSMALIRPVVSLRKDLRIIGGDGSYDFPYILNQG